MSRRFYASYIRAKRSLPSVRKNAKVIGEISQRSEEMTTRHQGETQKFLQDIFCIKHDAVALDPVSGFVASVPITPSKLMPLKAEGCFTGIADSA